MQQITTNKNELIYPKLSYIVVGVCFSAHNEIGRYAREKQYCNLIETKLRELKIPYKRELQVNDSGNVVDFLIDEKIVLEAKAKQLVSKNDYFQVQRYLQETGVKLGLLVNFRSKYLRPKRIIRVRK